MKSVLYFGAGCIAALSLVACNGKPSAVATQVASAPTAYGNSTSAPATAAGGSYGGSYASTDPRDAPVPKIDGKPMWSANRKHTAEENAQYQFAKNGGDFGARTRPTTSRKRTASSTGRPTTSTRSSAPTATS